MSASGHYNVILKIVSDFIKREITDRHGDEFAAVEAFETFLDGVGKWDDGIKEYIKSIIIIKGLTQYFKDESRSLYDFFKDQKEISDKYGV